MKRLSDCLCRWETVNGVHIMRVRTSTCPQHGDDTDWWAGVQSHPDHIGSSRGPDV